MRALRALATASALALVARLRERTEARCWSVTPNTPPTNWRADILAYLKTYLNDPTGVRDAFISEPEIRAGRRRPGSARSSATRSACVSTRRTRSANTKARRDRVIAFLDGKLDTMFLGARRAMQGRELDAVPGAREAEALVRFGARVGRGFRSQTPASPSPPRSLPPAPAEAARARKRCRSPSRFSAKAAIPVARVLGIVRIGASVGAVEHLVEARNRPGGEIEIAQFVFLDERRFRLGPTISRTVLISTGTRPAMPTLSCAFGHSGWAGLAAAAAARATRLRRGNGDGRFGARNAHARRTLRPAVSGLRAALLAPPAACENRAMKFGTTD